MTREAESFPIDGNGEEQDEKQAEAGSTLPTDDVEITIQQAQELVARLTAVRGALQDHLEDNPVIYSGVAALLDFVNQICRKLKATVLGAGSGPLQELLVQEVGQRLHEVDVAKHFTAPSFEAKIKQMNGYQSHIVSPEKALHALISDAFADCAPIAQWMVVAVRSFLSKAAQDCASDVVERDPDHRQQLADMIVQGVEEVLNEWEKEAAIMADEIMAMEKTIISPVFFQRLAIKRKQREAMGAKEETATGLRGAAQRVRASGAGLLARLRGNKGAAASDNGRKRPPKDADAEGDESDTGSRPSAPSFAGGRRAPSSSKIVGNFEPGPARNLRFVKHIKKWDAVSAVLLRDSQSQFQLVKGKCFKRAHATGIQKAVTKAWSARFFIFDCEKADLFYWKEQPTEEFVAQNEEQEHIKATRVSMLKARLSEPSKDEMKGFTGPETCGVRIENAYVKSKVDTVILGFASEQEKNSFIKLAGPSLGPKQAEPSQEEEVEVEERDPGNGQADDQEEDEDAAEMGGYRDEDEGDGEGGEEDEEEEEEEAPDSPTHSYRPGGLGVGSQFFNADDLRDKAGNKLITGELVLPSRFRTNKSRDKDAPEAPGQLPRIEGTEAMMWLTNDMNMYVTIVKDTVAATLPKMAVAVLLERIVQNDMLRRLQKMALQWQDTVASEDNHSAPRTLHSMDATSKALTDLENAMTDVRMACTQATLASIRERKKQSEVRCQVHMNSLALAGYGRILSAAQKPSPETVLEDLYGPLFPFKALEISDVAAKRWIAAEEYDRTRVSVNAAADPLAPPGGAAAASDAAAREQDAVDSSGLRGGNRSGMAAGVTSSVVEFAGRMRDGMTGRRRVTDQDVEEERRTISSQPQPLSAPPRRGGRGSSSAAPAAPAAAAADSGDALGAPAAPAAAPVSNDPLGGGGGLGPVMGFGTDPLSAPRAAARPVQSNGRSQQDAEEEEDEDEDDVPLQQRAAQSSGAPQRAPPRAPPARPAPARRAPPGPGGAPPPRAAPPAPGIGRPGPLRTAPGRPAPAPAGRPAPMRPGTGSRDNLPL